MPRNLPALLAAGAVLLTVASPVTASLAAPSEHATSVRNSHVCAAPSDRTSASCDAIIHEHVDDNGKVVPNATSGPSGYGPADLQSAYGLSVSESGGAGRTVAIVDAYDDL